MTTEIDTSPIEVPLCVDCDGTLIAGDLLVEAILRCLHAHPAILFRFPGWLLAGKAVFKQKVAGLSEFEPETLPDRAEVVAFLRAEHDRGRKIYLVTAADQTLAEKVASHLGVFHGVLASDGRLNLKGRAKAQRLVELFGREGFDYAGDHQADLPVWDASRNAIAVAASAATLRKLKAKKIPALTFPRQEGRIRTWLRLMRIHQWAKNLLIFVPLITSHRFTEIPILAKTLLGFFAFGLVGSSTYILNDLADIHNDRVHRSKRSRPLASGEISPMQAIAFGCVLLAGGASLCLGLSRSCALILACYLGLTTSYTLFFKRKLMMDVVVLTGLYAIRIALGHAAGDIPFSVWLSAFAMFTLFSLALAKRYTELVNPAVRQGGRIKGRGYQPGDEVPVSNLGAASGMIGILVLVLYVNSPEVQKLYREPHVLLLLCPLFLYWIGRIWLLTQRGELHDDPVVFALRDRASYAVGSMAALILVLASPK